MKTSLIDRRDFLRAAGAGFVAAMAPPAWAKTLAADAVFATAFVKRDGSYGAAILSEAGKLLHAIDLPDRGHDVTFDPISKRSVVFARQPGTFAVVFDHSGCDEPLTIASITGRHFFGHGVFSPDGALLYATENDFDNAAGVVGVYDARAKFKRLGEFPTYGMGPHELLLLGDGRTIAVANGGIETHPDYGRAELNIATMKPSYVLIDRVTGDLVEKHELPAALHQLSIRHMDTDQTGTVWFGCQYRGPGTDRPLLVGRAARGKDLQLLDMPRDVLSGFRNYIGSVAANPVAGTIAVSSPEGNSLVVIDAASGRLVSSSALVEVCGVAPDGTGFMATTGAGEIVECNGATWSEPYYVWDNHMLRIEPAA
ncbi:MULTISPECIES: DUF1513 domain-containing protein [unclassified Mesorhizobium]|uniref:DUF1513 domain-containing protein n=1 Tax=unclassified Mesorhizobium TaxID=325217 RepID=UPI00112ECF92|nr:MULTISPECIES: DUF1513 domain-containing protein [unclassified Mesorhizobium]MBZ9982280.1 DUF1513 domain-containing protein [Mesorhizobium sp. BR-1-1-8]TPL34800.1 DUF1513 domain-containing protein [Mesorhizobium sp. B2-4-8]TPL64622.1 DUF1513 domain-containing protein [Mesorhizobium sp. B2-4-1]TPM00317.1 DUF1513 domain-containing protein [Mesorhizobium sp. B2-3-8]TPM11982.1 DUF1513 domain-containing protein [Mesorhizobium sp. B2-3-7]